MRHTGSDETSEITMSLRRREVRSLRNGAKTGSPRLGCERGQDTKADIDRLNSAAWKGSNRGIGSDVAVRFRSIRSEEHTSELQSHLNLVCRLLLEKKKLNATTT